MLLGWEVTEQREVRDEVLRGSVSKDIIDAGGSLALGAAVPVLILAVSRGAASGKLSATLVYPWRDIWTRKAEWLTSMLASMQMKYGAWPTRAAASQTWRKRRVLSARAWA